MENVIEKYFIEKLLNSILINTSLWLTLNVMHLCIQKRNKVTTEGSHASP